MFHFCAPENVKKPSVFCFQEVWKGNIGYGLAKSWQWINFVNKRLTYTMLKDSNIDTRATSFMVSIIHGVLLTWNSISKLV